MVTSLQLSEATIAFQSLTNMVSLHTTSGVMAPGEGLSSSPLGIACSPNGSIYVSNHDKRIQVFSDY